MDLTQGTAEEKNNRAKKMMLWFGIISLIMSFGGLTSAFIVSSKREDWFSDFIIPKAFTISLIVIIISSVTFILAKRALKKENRQQVTIYLMLTLILGVVFVISQFAGFREIIALGYNFTGPTSNITMSYVFLIAFVHILHVAVGLICLLVVVYKHLMQKYSADKMLGFELAATFWHFVDLLWIYLFLFLLIMK